MCASSSTSSSPPWIHSEGIHWQEPIQSELLFETLNKSEALFSPTGQCAIHHEARGWRVLRTAASESRQALCA